MTNKYTNELYERIKDSFSEKKNGGAYKNILKTKADNTYIVRIIPNTDNPEKTLFQYYMHGWNSPIDGQYVSALCPTTFGEDCPICNERFRLWKKGDEASKELSKNLARKERFFANVYVVDDPETEENNGTVKVLGYGRQIAKIIDEAMNGDDAEEIGGRMFDFTDEGCNLRIKVEKNKAGYPNYDRSKFVNPSHVPVSLEDVVDQIHDFDDLLSRKTTDEMKTMLESALYGNTIESEPETTVTNAVTEKKEKKEKKEKSPLPIEEDVEDDIPMEFDDNGESDEENASDIDLIADLDEILK